MGNITKNRNEVKSSFFGCGGCAGEKNMCGNPSIFYEVKVDETPDSNNSNNLNYFNTPDMITKNDSNNNYKKRKKNFKLNQYNNLNFREEDIDKFNKNKYELNPKIKELQALIGENSNFELTEKESFYIKNKVSENYLIQKLLHYKDDSYYLGFINKNNYNKELYGTYYYNDDSIYKGFFENDKIKGRGRLMLVNRYVYEGDFDEGLFNGFGKLYTLNGLKYEGNWKNDMQDGYGIEKYSDGSCYTGMFKKGIKHGKGKFEFKNGDIYEGDFENEEMTGWGVYKRKDGRIYIGMVKRHLIEGIGVFIWKDNKRYLGEYHNELKDGFGIFYTNDGRNYAGFWKEGKQHGVGIITNVYGQKYYAKYNNGEKISFASEQEKKDIDNLILEGEKKINKNKLIKIADEIIIEREKGLKNENSEKKVKFEKMNKTDITKNDKIIFVKNNTRVIEKKKLKQFNSITSISCNKMRIINKNNILNKDEISNSFTPSIIINSVLSDIGSIQINNNVTKCTKNNNKCTYSKNEDDKITSQSTKVIFNVNKYNKDKNKSCINLNLSFNFINDNLKLIRRNKSEVKLNINRTYII